MPESPPPERAGRYGLDPEIEASVRARDRPETPAQRADRNFVDLLQELRVLQTGVQILFAFLLSLAFTDRFAREGHFGNAVYLWTLLSTATSTACLIAPVALHRAVFARGMKTQLVVAGARLMRAGMVTLFLALVGAVLLVADLVVPRGWAVVIALVPAVTLVSLWWVLPTVLRRRWARAHQAASAAAGPTLR
jgi:hypothetical protein